MNENRAQIHSMSRATSYLVVVSMYTILFHYLVTRTLFTSLFLCPPIEELETEEREGVMGLGLIILLAASCGGRSRVSLTTSRCFALDASFYSYYVSPGRRRPSLRHCPTGEIQRQLQRPLNSCGVARWQRLGRASVVPPNYV